MSNYKILIVEDDPNIADTLKDMLETMEHDVIGVFDNGPEAILFLTRNKVDLVLLDIQLRGRMNGIEVAGEIQETNSIPFIFTTAYADSKTIAKAKEKGPYGYIVKPYGMKDIYAAIEIAINNYKLLDELQVPQLEAADLRSNHLYLKVDTKLVKVDEDDILYVEAKGDYVLFKTLEKGFVVNATMKKVEEKLNSTKFLKVHRSYIINLDKIVDIENTTLVINDKVIPISRSHKDSLLSRLNTL
ncbi:LytR/AlgR family response regulator transcription factor [Owenweeksia hongkongensis]|uniref:Response regulator of the LytR/AlgR family n=1 Tax=Owenweeksia hongkongensis (strain DSM 17368 / CIP 108786 / JCM 12287 / NRRL B-23963 / UST20020801) TaxID=926562 RepID=G8QZS4_OWEHD|nr:response regulator [Owenweeksia hongkongensis]AEV31518.1 response regulator of the LytR/AlgR family [Owenweeksia hongkongensis DSM 17368]